jgi:hypothetical protein
MHEIPARAAVTLGRLTESLLRRASAESISVLDAVQAQIRETLRD